MCTRPSLAVIYVLLCSSWLAAQVNPTSNANGFPYPPKMDGAQIEVYRTVDGVELNIFLFYPQAHEPNESRPAIVFFFGGGWKGGSPAQFEQQCRHLASRGMVAMTADYRVRTRHGTTADQCVMDAKSAIRWVRTNARRLGVDPDRIVAGGGSAGGHLAVCTAVMDDLDAPREDKQVSSQPNGLVLFNPALVLAPITGLHEISDEKQKELRERLGVSPERLSPFHQLHRRLPPTIIFHGKADRTVPFRTIELFTQAAKQLDSPIELIGFEEAGHGFFNFGRGQNERYRNTLLRLDQFLVDHGLLEGPSPNAISLP